MNRSPTERLLALLRTIPSAEAQNRHMRIADRELALSMMYMEEEDRRKLLSRLAVAKSRRIREELALQKHLAVRYDQYRRAIENVIGQIGSSAASPLRSYLRPRRKRDR